MQPPERRSLWDLIAASGLPASRFVADASGRTFLHELATGTTLGESTERFRGQSALISSNRQLPSVLAMAELDGVARRVVLCPPDVAAAHIPSVIADAEIDVILTDGTGPAGAPIDGTPSVQCGLPIRMAGPAPDRRVETEWLLFTSGTTGHPKMVIHTLRSLTGPLNDGLVVAPQAVWSTFYDVRRYGGLQILMRAFLGGSSMVLSQAGEAVGDFLDRAAADGITHISGTPSHWRRALMTPGTARFAPDYVRLSGEVADQAILNNLRQAFPAANIAHAFASTEAGVAFDVRDGLAGFPTAVIDQHGGQVEMRIQDGSLRIRSSRTSPFYAGHPPRPIADPDGFVDTGDMVERRGDRYYFIGRREGIINVGGLKVHPEEVEAVINQHPAVRMSRVRARPSPITGAIVVADIVVETAGRLAEASFAMIRDEILETCRQALPPHKVPAMLREVPALDIAESGKLVRRNA